MTDAHRHLGTAFGVELEYMIVDAQSLDIRPLADELLQAAAGKITGDYVDGPITWSNELVNHVVEFKTSEPATSLEPLPVEFQRSIGRANERLARLGARLLPTAAHPWMDPLAETRLWPHENSEVYRTFDRVFDCRGHGWSNLQSAHLNLPFVGDAEFARLHAAVRLVLPLLPALAASSPILDGRQTDCLDKRLDYYRRNSQRIPSIVAQVVPEPLFTFADYHREVFERIDRDIAPHDPDGVLEHEWLNARGAIARFSRGTIEIRLLDVQECPSADLAIVAAVSGLIEVLTAERWSSLADQQSWPTEPLADMLTSAICDADRAVLTDARYLAMFGVRADRMTAGELWSRLIDDLEWNRAGGPWSTALTTIVERGPLARRILAAVGDSFDRETLRAVYGRLADCLARGEMFLD